MADTLEFGTEKVSFVPDKGFIGENVTELPGQGVTNEQLAMLHTRYSIATELAANKDVLELACGPGVGLGCLAQHANKVVGGDLNLANINAAAQQYQKEIRDNRIEVLHLDAHQLPFEDNSFDLVMMLDSIYFLADAERFVSEAYRVLRNNGNLFVTSSNPERRDFNRCPYSIKYFSVSEFHQLLQQAGFEPETSLGFPVLSGGFRQRVLGRLQTTATRLGLIPKSSTWKIRLKRCFFGQLQVFPSKLVVDDKLCQQPVSLDQSMSIENYKIIYATGRKQVASSIK